MFFKNDKYFRIISKLSVERYLDLVLVVFYY